MSTKKVVLIGTATLIFLTAGIVAPLINVSAASFFGAIYTTLGDGTSVDANIYDAKPDVYLNGGPQNFSANGLPDGIYYYQVTDPSGQTLLSTDPAVCRQLQVVNGRISGSVSSGTDPECQHANGSLDPNNGSTPVQLIPFADTPNNGGEYKVWLIRQTDTTSISTTDNTVIIFNSNDAKTDNFKVLNTSCEPYCPPPPPTPTCTPTPTPTPDFSISGTKFYDINGDGIMNSGSYGSDFALGGFLIQTDLVPALNGGNPVSRITGNDGTWEIAGIPNLTDYYSWEVVPDACNAPIGAYWEQTAPSTLITPPSLGGTSVAGHEGTISGLDVTDLDFGNRCLSSGSGGHTLGFWSNKNGQALITSGDLTALAGLNLRNANGSAFDPASKSAYRTWLLSANATNMAYMLSAQMSATYLNVAHGFIDGDALLDVGGEIGTINDWLTEANTSLGSYGNTVSPHAQRANQERLKNIFDAINNNNFVFIHTSCTACAYNY